ncbi:hypothetical protein J6590_041744 [Homalodisca vitripennis]|nr:hypothetical protein J6590_041744 [Homalodisca vitripennis]
MNLCKTPSRLGVRKNDTAFPLFRGHIRQRHEKRNVHILLWVSFLDESQSINHSWQQPHHTTGHQGTRPSSHQVKPIQRQSPVPAMVLEPVVEEEVDRIIQQLPPKKSNDINLMSMWLIKQCSKNNVRPLTI